MAPQQLSQSGQNYARPYITVGLDDRGGITCADGETALAELKAATNPPIDPGHTI